MSYCSNCGTRLGRVTNFCPKCGQAFGNNSSSNSIEQPRIIYVQSPAQDIYVHARKSKGLALTLCFFLGWMGAHEFYLRNYFTGSLYLIFSWTFIPFLLSFLDFILLLLTPKSIFHKRYDK